MADEKQKMQADGNGTRPRQADDTKEIASRQPKERQGAGESGGGPYPNPRSDGADGGKSGGFKGGQSDQAYFGKGQLGAKKVGKNANAPSTDERE